jgi:hypothetical protein
MQEINHDAPKSEPVAKAENTEKKPDDDPRRRIVKLTIEDKRKVDDVLYKMFGGRKN